MSKTFEGQVAIVTGGAKGIGAATVEALVAQGARVAAFDVDATAGAALAQSLDGCEFHAVDLTDRDAVQAAVAAVVANTGRLDMLVNNAGIAPPLTLEAMRSEDFQNVLAVNLTGAFHCLEAVVPHMKTARSGAIVNLSSVAGKNISLGAGFHYTASKWGMIGLSRHLAYELAPYGIRVNIVCPGPTLTSLIKIDDDAKNATAQGLPLGRWVKADDVANAVLFFLGPGAAMCTGSELVVDGGALLGSGNGYDAYFQQRGAQPPERTIERV